MKRSASLAIAGWIGLVMAAEVHAVQPCADPSACAQVSVSTVGGDTATPGQVATAAIFFQQGPSGALSQIAALALTLGIPGGTGQAPLTLADCTLNADGLPNAVHPAASLSGFKVVVENACCSSTRTHCLCPSSAACPATSNVTPDDFINLVVYGPNPLPPPSATPIVIPTLPSSSTEALLTVDLKLGATVGGYFPLHIYNEVLDSQTPRPQFTALLSVGDVNAVDQTCAAATPPCSDPNGASQVAITDTKILVSGGCTGNCNYDSAVTVDELLTMVNVALGTSAPSACYAGDTTGTGQITVDEILAAVNNALGGCPT